MESYCGFENVEALALDTANLFSEVLEVPAECVPEVYRGKRDRISLASLNRTFNREIAPKIRRAQIKAEKAARIEFYARQIANGSEQIVYNTDGDRQYRAELVFAKALRLFDEE